MKPFAYLHWSTQKELEAIYLYDGEYTYLEFPKLLISISSLTDACAIFETRSKADFLSAAFDYVEYDYIYSNDVEQTVLFLDGTPYTQPRSVSHLEALPLQAVYDIAAGTLARESRHWFELSRELENDASNPIVGATRGTLSKIQSILNRARFA